MCHEVKTSRGNEWLMTGTAGYCSTSGSDKREIELAACQRIDFEYVLTLSFPEEEQEKECHAVYPYSFYVRRQLVRQHRAEVTSEAESGEN